MDKYTQDIIDAGNDILKSVSKAIDSNDYSKLVSDINETVKAVSYERKTTYSSTTRRKQKPKEDCPFLMKKISKYLGFPQLLFGGMAAVFIFLPGFLGSLFVEAPAIVITFLALFAISGFISLSGLRKFKLAQKYYQYGKILGNADYFAIKDLAKVALKSDDEVLKDIKDMIKEGFLPRAKMDRTDTTCMITDAAYEMYLGAEKDRLEREIRESKEAELKNNLNKETKNMSSGERSIVDEGNDYITFVRQINDVIPDTEEMSNKLYRLEEIMNRIFEQVKKDPSSADELHKLMSYYLPTTKKLLTAYVELDKQPADGENVRQTKHEIDMAMDTINEAFERLLDSLFQDMAWDISSDISVMKTMMAQDGLTYEGPMAQAQGQGMASQGQALQFEKES